MRCCKAASTAGGAAKSMSATHSGRMSRPAYLPHLMESECRRSGGVSNRLKPRGSNFEVLVEGGGKVAFAEGRNHDDDQLAGIFRALGQFERGPGRGAGGNADQQAFFARHAAGDGEGVVVLDADHLVVDRGVQHARYETGADALDRVRSLGATGQYRRGIGFDGDDLDARLP